MTGTRASEVPLKGTAAHTKKPKRRSSITSPQSAAINLNPIHMLHRALIIGLVASSTALHLKQQPVMKLRGGLAGLDADQVSKVVMGISAANAGVMALAPTKAGEM